MANYYIHVGSITNAMRGIGLLEKQGIRAFLHRSTHPEENDGCGYHILITEAPARAEGILRKGGVRIIRITEAM